MNKYIIRLRRLGSESATHMAISAIDMEKAVESTRVKFPGCLIYSINLAG